MRIFIDTRALDAGIISGIPAYAGNLIKNLTEEYPSNEFIFFSNSFKKRKLDPERKKIGGNGVWTDYRIPNRLLDLSSHILDFPKIDKLIKADVYWSPHFHILAFKNQRKHVLTIHDLSPLFYPEYFPWRKRLWHWQQNYKKQIKTAGHIVGVSEFTRDTILETFNLPESKVSSIYSGVDDFYKKLPSADDNLANFKKEKKLDGPFVLYVGTLEPRKNITGLIKAFNLLKQNGKFKDLKLVLAGDNGWLYEKILREIDLSPHKEDIVRWGRAEKKDLLYLYNSASVFVYPSFFEGFGFPPLEAQASGIPVVSSDRSSLPEILKESAILVNPWKTYELSMAMELVLLENKTRESLIESGYRNIQRFNWKNTAAGFMKLFEQINSNG